MPAAFRPARLFARRRPVARPPRASRVGSAAPELSGVTPAGDPVRIETGSGARLVAAFLTSSCTTCGTFWTALGTDGDPAMGAVATGAAGAPATEAADPAMVVVTPDPTTEDRRALARLAPASTPVVMSTEGWIRWGVSGSPFFVVVADGTIVAEGVASDWGELLALIPAA
ncbi:MAG: hypothetical protein M3Y36_07955 [Actinomycetota bacterium]|nr:hypothetical protein [Actinomycetota bacterium]